MATRIKEELPTCLADLDVFFLSLEATFLIDDVPSERKVALLLARLTPNSLSKALAMASLTTFVGADYETVKTAIRNHYLEDVNQVLEATLFFSMMQGNLSTNEFIIALRQQIKKFDPPNSSFLLQVQFVRGLRDRKLADQLTFTKDTTLDDFIQRSRLEEKKSTPAPIVNAIQDVLILQCWSCGENHRRSTCSKREAICTFCQRKGHIERACMKKKSSNKVTKAYDLLLISENELDFVTVYVNDHPLRFLVDSGSQATIIPRQLATKYNFEHDGRPVKMKAYGNTKRNNLVSFSGTIRKARFSFGTRSIEDDILVGQDDDRLILGKAVSKALGIITVKTEPDPPTVLPLSLENGRFKASFKLKDDASFAGMIFKARTLGYSIQPLAKAAILRMVEENILKPIKHPKIASPIVPVLKTMSMPPTVRICCDFSQTLNKIIDPDAYPLPTREDITVKMANTRVYSTLDLRDAFLQIELDERSKELTTIATPFGYFAFNRLPFGVSAAPLIFQEAIDKVLEGIPHCAAYLDDIIIGTQDEDLHATILKEVSDRLQKHHFAVNETKSRYHQQRVKYLGFILEEGTLLPDPSRIDAFRNLAMPKTVEQLHSLLGSLRFYGDFTAKFSQRTKPLYLLLRKDVIFEWKPEFSQIVKELIDEIADGSLVCYDPLKPLFLTCDASQHGLGYVLSHDSEMRQIVATGGRILSKAEENYSNIEREGLGIYAGVSHFRKYLLGRPFTIQSDHSPLQYIFDGKNASKRVSHRLQRWALELSGYNFKVAYRKGDDMLMADSISRLTTEEDEDVTDINLRQINAIMASPEQDQLLRLMAASKDKSYNTLKKFITSGWPASLPTAVLPYTQCREELSIQDGVVYRGIQAVPPPDVRRRVLQLTHDGHSGVVQMKRVTRQSFWWPKMDLDINAYVNWCQTCTLHARRRTNQHLRSWAEPLNVFERLHADVGHFKDAHFLMIVDAYSRWVTVRPLRNNTATEIVSRLIEVFSYHGKCQSLVTDNGTNFCSKETENFLQDLGIRHIRTPPGHHQSNGLAETYIGWFKDFLLKNELQVDQSACMLYMQAHNNSPDSRGSIPNSLVMSYAQLKVNCAELGRTNTKEMQKQMCRREDGTFYPSTILDSFGSRTFADESGRMIHENDVFQVTDPDVPEASPTEEQSSPSPTTVPSPEDIPDAAPETEPELLVLPSVEAKELSGLRRSKRAPKPRRELTTFTQFL